MSNRLALTFAVGLCAVLGCVRVFATELDTVKLLEPIDQAANGAPKFTAIDAVANKIKQSDPASRAEMLTLVIAVMNDRSRSLSQRWPCCYVISGCGGEQGVPELVRVLHENEFELMRSVAAEALANLSGNSGAHEALLQAARKETNAQVRAVLAKRLGKDMPALDPQYAPPVVKELAPGGPPKPPPGPTKPVTSPLPWPFPGDQKAQNIQFNYQYVAGDYIHIALDFMQPAGTPVRAVDSGYVAEIYSEPSHKYDRITVTTQKGGDRGWSYSHLDSRTFKFREGDFVRREQVLGNVTEFSLNGSRGDHLHLCYVSFNVDSSNRKSQHSLLDPLCCFDWKDDQPPVLAPLMFVKEGSTEQFRPDSSGIVTVNGNVDILATISDVAYLGQGAVYGVPVVMLSISDGTHTAQRLVLDHRGDVIDWKQVKPLYLTLEEGRKLFNIKGAGFWQTLRVTKTDGDGLITPKDANECWHTAARDAGGRPTWPDGIYNVNVYAWDIAGNRGVVGAKVQVKNGLGAN